MNSLLNENFIIYDIPRKFLFHIPNQKENNELQQLKEKKTLFFIFNRETNLSRLIPLFKIDYKVLYADNLELAYNILDENDPNIVIIDVSIPDFETTIFEKVKLLKPKSKMLLLSEDKQGFAKNINNNGYKFKNIEQFVDLKDIVTRTIYIQHLEINNELLSHKLLKQKQFKDVIGDSPQMIRIFDVIKKVINTDVNIFLTGETGTGKTLLARAIHYQSHRQDYPLVSINCGAIPEEQLSNELFGIKSNKFGYEKDGKLKLANKGTIFLSEIEKLSHSLQVQLYQFIQKNDDINSEIDKTNFYDVRILSASNKDLKKKVLKNKFRSDLYYQLSVVNLKLPPLHQRKDDIILLANWYLNKYSHENSGDSLKFHPDAFEKMREYKWPGNIRELKNRIKRAVIMNQDNIINWTDLGLGDSSSFKKESLNSAINNIQKEYITDALSGTNGNISKAAKELGISRMSLYEMLNRFQIEVNKYRKYN